MLAPVRAAHHRSPLARDERGAIMILGLFMALALIGMLWFLLGIGATIAFKENLQQTADAAAFSAAVTHARDMNLIVALNLVMFVLIGVWLVLCVTYTVMEIVSIYAWIVGVVSCIVGCEGLADAAELEELKENVGQLKQEYQTVLNTALPTLSVIQDGVALFSDPKAIVETGVQILASQKTPKYAGVGFSVDVPNPSAAQHIGQRVGLPVESEKNSALCGHAVNWVLGYVEDLLNRNPIVKKLLNLSWAERQLLKIGLSKYVSANPALGFAVGDFDKLLDEVRNMTGKGMQALYCSGGVWDEAGPKRMWRSDPKSDASMAKNASDWMQTWGVAFPMGTFDDNDAEHKIGIASRTNQQHTDPSALESFSYAEGEYYLDCSGKWADGDCNGINTTVKDSGIDAAMYRLEWRARLVRVHTPKGLPGGAIFSAVNGVLSDRATIKELEDSGPVAAPLREALSAAPKSALDFLNALPAGSFH